MTDYLIHYGVKGMKWGVRKQGVVSTQKRKIPSNAMIDGPGIIDENPMGRYSIEQKKRDQQIYSKGASRRISKSVNEGSTISAARSKEADRINRTRRRSIMTGQIGAVVGGVGGVLGGYRVANRLIDMYSATIPELNDPTVSLAVKGAISSGTAKVATQLGRYGGQSVGMLSGGYNPNKFRY